jgi:RNA recognition motif-containing protein
MELFHQHSVSCRILLNKNNGKETYAFVDVEYGEAMEKCFAALDGKELEGRKLRVFPSNDLTPSVLARLGISEATKNQPLVRPRGSNPHQGHPLTLVVFGLPPDVQRTYFEKFKISTYKLLNSRRRKSSVVILTFAKRTAGEDAAKAYQELHNGEGGCQANFADPDLIEGAIKDWRSGKQDSFGVGELLGLDPARPLPSKRSHSEQSRDESSDQSSDESSPSESDSPPPRKRPRKKKIPPSDYPSFSTSPPPYSSCPPRPVLSVGFKNHNPLPPLSHSEEFSYPPGFERNPNQEEYLRKRWVQRTGRSDYIAEQEPPGILDYGAGF